MLTHNTLTQPGWLLAISILLAGCDDPTSPSPPVATPQVVVTVIQPQSIAISDTLPGRVNALRVAEIRPQVSGIIQRRLFEQGAEIKQGTPLYQINPAPFKADVDSAQAALQRAQAVWEKARQQTSRLRSLIQTQAVSRQSFDDALSAEKQSAADVAQARATLTRKQLDLSFATVDAPIAGRIDQTLASEGAYVTASDTSPLARIYQTDPIYIDVRQPAEVYDALREQFSVQNPNAALPVTVLRASGAAYMQQGKVLFSGIAVDSGTGEVMLRVEVPNPDRVLLPGMFVRVQIPRQHIDDALLVPQQAVVRENGKTALWVVDEQQQVKLINVDVADITRGHYRITRGLSAGMRVVIQGMDKLSDGLKVAALMPAAVANDLALVQGQ
jgi:multidrug efflux system membrane fusion protein